MDIFSETYKALDGHWRDVGRTLKAYCGLRTSQLISDTEVDGWRRFFHLVLLTLAVSALSIAVFYPNGQLDFLGMVGRMVWPFLNGAVTYLLVWLIIAIARRRNRGAALATIFGCHLIVASLALALGILIAMADPVARSDIFLLREGQGARTPVHGVVCGNFDLHLRALRENQSMRGDFGEFQSQLQIFHEESRQRHPNLEAVEAAYQRIQQIQDGIDGHTAALMSLEAERQEAWATLRRSYLSLKIAYWAFLTICFLSAGISLLHLWKIAVHDPGKRRWATALAMIGAFLTVPLAWGTYGTLKSLRWYNQPDIAMTELIRSAQLRYRFLKTHCPEISNQDLWDQGANHTGIASRPDRANSPPSAPSGSD